MSRQLRILAGLILVPMLLVAAPTPPAKTQKADWPLFRGDTQQTGIAATRIPDKLEVLWTFKTGDAFEGAVAVADGLVFAASMDEHLYAVDLKNGKKKWVYPANKNDKKKPGPFKAPVSVRKGLVYAGDVDGYLHCVDAAKGTRKWVFEAGAELGGANFFKDDVLVGSHDESLYCIDKDGKQRWKFSSNGEIHGSVAVAGDVTFLVGCDSKMHVIDVAKGTEVRSVDLNGQTAATAAVVGDHVYVGTMGSVVCGIDWKKGTVTWTYKPGRGAQGFFASAAVTDKVVIIGSRDRKVHCIDRKTGKQVWTYPTGGQVDSSPVIAGNRVVVGSHDKHVHVIDLANGKQVQKLKLDDDIVASPVVVEGKVLIGTRKGTLYCLGAKKGG